MKLVDDRGKLFGIINLVDLLLLLTLLAVIGGVGYKILEPMIRERISPPQTLTMVCRVRNVYPRVYESIKDRPLPAQLIAGNSLVKDAYVTAIEAVPYENQLPTDDGRYESAVDPNRIDLMFTIEAKVPSGMDVLKVGTQEVRVGLGQYVKTTWFEFSANIEYLWLS